MNVNSGGDQTFRHCGHNFCPKVILEGTRITKKTELAFALNEHPDLSVLENIAIPRQSFFRREWVASPTSLGVKGKFWGKEREPWPFGLTSFGSSSLSISLSVPRCRPFYISPNRRYNFRSFGRSAKDSWIFAFFVTGDPKPS
jgi:hypothetical protein